MVHVKQMTYIVIGRGAAERASREPSFRKGMARCLILVVTLLYCITLTAATKVWPSHHASCPNRECSIEDFPTPTRVWCGWQMPPKQGVLSDKQVAGGESLRKVDHSLSAQYGGCARLAACSPPSAVDAVLAACCRYRSEKPGSTVYGKYVEPVLHAAEHTRRAVTHGNGVEWARAKDELKTVGTGLQSNQKQYQRAAEKAQQAKPAPKKP